jgi:TatD DNase family protein
MITDTHTHLFEPGLLRDLPAVLERARAAGVERCLVVGTDPESSRLARELCRQHPGLFPTAGIHPGYSESFHAQARAEIESLAVEADVVAIGETGLDFFRGRAQERGQLENFEWALDLARRLDKPAVIHCRSAHLETARAVAACPGVRAVMHCYGMGPEELPPYLEAGFYISFSGMVTYPKNEENRRAAERVPLERLLVETDCPYLPPQDKRGQRNEPSFVPAVVRLLAEQRGLTPAALAAQTSENATRLFRLPAAAGSKAP